MAKKRDWSIWLILCCFVLVFLTACAGEKSEDAVDTEASANLAISFSVICIPPMDIKMLHKAAWRIVVRDKKEAAAIHR